jgi:hypothetical protein
VGKSKDKTKDMNKLRCFACQKPCHYASSCPNKKKVKKEAEVTASAATDEFAEKFEEFSLMACLASNGCLVCADINAWFVDSGASRHMIGMRFIFLSFSEIDSDCYVGCGASTRHVLAVSWVGCVKFQLESRGFLELAEVLFVPELPVNLLSISALDVDGCGVVFFRGLVFLYPEGATPDTVVFLGVQYERLYRLLEQPMVGSNGYLDSETVSLPETRSCEASSSTVRRPRWYKMTHMDALKRMRRLLGACL